MDNAQTLQNEIVLDGHPDIIQARRTAIKLAQKAKIIVALPIGGKPVIDVFQAPDGVQYANERGFRAQGLVPVQFLMSHMNWTPPLNVSISYMVKMNMLSSHARQVMTMEAIRQGAEYIFYVDDDTLIPPLGLYTLYNWMEQNPHAGAISGVYTTRETPNEPLIYKEHGDGCAWDFEMGPGANPELIFGAGAGCLLARVSAIKDVMEKLEAEHGYPVPVWADEKDLPNAKGQSVMWGHDIRFCRLLNLAGHPVYVHGQILCGHYDIRTGKTFVVPDTAPGLQKTRDRLGNINTAQYWDQVYSYEGADNWRKYPAIFDQVTAEVEQGSYVTELGCGVGILGTKLTAEKQVKWRGLDVSPTAVDMCKTRFLTAQVLDLRSLRPDHMWVDQSDHVVVMTETLEHLERPIGVQVLGTIRHSNPSKIIITTPDNCMGPEELPEHTALFNKEYVQAMLDEADFSEYNVEFTNPYPTHLMCVVTRK